MTIAFSPVVGPILLSLSLRLCHCWGETLSFSRSQETLSASVLVLSLFSVVISLFCCHFWERYPLSLSLSCFSLYIVVYRSEKDGTIDELDVLPASEELKRAIKHMNRSTEDYNLRDSGNFISFYDFIERKSRPRLRRVPSWTLEVVLLHGL
jgi:hypothetical protein